MEVAQLAVKIVITQQYGHDVYLIIKEATHAANSSSATSDKSQNKTYDYSYILPSARTLNHYKQMQASQAELKSACTLYKKNSSLKLTIHFDTSTRSSIDGEWSSLIVIFSDGQEFRLRPLFFTYEDCQQITELLVETLICFSIAATAFYDFKVSPSHLF